MTPVSLGIIVLLVILVIAGGLWLHFRKPKPPAGKLVLFGVGNDKKTLYSAAEGATAWTAAGPSAGVYTVAFNPADKRLYGVDENLTLQSAVPGQAWAPVPNGDPSGDRLSSVAFDAAGAMWGVTINGALVTKGKNPAGPWTVTAPAIGGNIFNIAFDAAGAMWGVARQAGLVFTKTSPSAAWTAVTAAGAVDMYNIHTDHQTGTFYGVGGPWQVYTSPNLAKTPWTAATVSSDSALVQDVAVARL
jgi:hypothetical protein